MKEETIDLTVSPPKNSQPIIIPETPEGIPPASSSHIPPAQAGSSSDVSSRQNSNPTHSRADKLQAQIESAKGDILDLDQRIAALKQERKGLQQRIHQWELELRERVASENWSVPFPWSEQLRTAARDVFGVTTFRPHQEEALNATLSHRDVLVVMPTGGGKSLIYQLPACIERGVSLVVSPLLSLMEDQVAQLNRRGLPAAILCGDTPKEVVSTVYADLARGTRAGGGGKKKKKKKKKEEEGEDLSGPNTSHSEGIKVDNKGGEGDTDTPTLRFLYLTPEKIVKAKTVLHKLEQLYAVGLLNRIVIDECHCMSTWGHDFRPDYAKLGMLKGLFPTVPLVAVTATGSVQVRAQVKEGLQMTQCASFFTHADRPNLRYSLIIHNESFDVLSNSIASLITQRFGHASGIVYTFSRKEASSLAARLSSLGIPARQYHSEVAADIKGRSQAAWQDDKGVQVIVATVAFGMGIDKPDVRFVIHTCLSKSLEAYYQESGRAGRDGQQASCILYFTPQDFFRVSTMVFYSRSGMSHLGSMMGYCLANQYQCLRRYLCSMVSAADLPSEICQPANCTPCLVRECRSSADVDETTQRILFDRPERNEALLRVYLVQVTQVLCDHEKREKMLTLKGLVSAWKKYARQWAKEVGPAVVNSTFHDPSANPAIVDTLQLEMCICRLILPGYLKLEFKSTPYSTIAYVVMGLVAPVRKKHKAQ